MNKILYLSAAVVALAQISAPSFAMDNENSSRNPPKKPSRFVKKSNQQQDRFDPPAIVDNASLLKIYSVELTGTNKDESAHELDKKRTGRHFAIGETGAYVDIIVNGKIVQAAHKEPSSIAKDRKLNAINTSQHIVAILDEPETRVQPTMGVDTHESVGGKYKLYDDSSKQEVMTEIDSWDYTGPKPKETKKKVETFVSLVFSRPLTKDQ